MQTHTTIVDTSVDGQPMAVFVAQPSTGANLPSIVIAFEAFGMTEYIREIAQTLAADGYIVAVPDLYHRVGRLLNVPYSEYNAAVQANLAAPLESRRLMATLDDGEVTRDLTAAVEYARHQPGANFDSVGALGFWNGGRLAYMLACRRPEVKAVVSFYGHIVSADTSEKRPISLLELTDQLLGAALFLWGKEGQPQTLAEIRTLEDRLRSHGKQFHSQVYDVPRGFHNPNIPMFEATAAHDAWLRTRNWYARNLASE